MEQLTNSSTACRDHSPLLRKSQVPCDYVGDIGVVKEAQNYELCYRNADVAKVVAVAAASALVNTASGEAEQSSLVSLVLVDHMMER